MSSEVFIIGVIPISAGPMVEWDCFGTPRYIILRIEALGDIERRRGERTSICRYVQA